MSEAEFKAVGEAVQGKSWRLEEFKDVFEMGTDPTGDPVLLLKHWKKEMEKVNVVPRPYLVHYLMCMNMEEMAAK